MCIRDRYKSRLHWRWPRTVRPKRLVFAAVVDHGLIARESIRFQWSVTLILAFILFCLFSYSRMASSCFWHCWCKTSQIIVITVSYTHLDVYKRQPLDNKDLVAASHRTRQLSKNLTMVLECALHEIAIRWGSCQRLSIKAPRVCSHLFIFLHKYKRFFFIILLLITARQ